MVSTEERGIGWEVRKLYDKPNPEHLEQSSFFSAFAQFHDINGRRMECIMTKPKYRGLSVKFTGPDAPEVNQVSAILFVDLNEVSGMMRGESVKVDGVLYVIEAISYPLGGMCRMELSGVNG